MVRTLTRTLRFYGQFLRFRRLSHGGARRFTVRWRDRFPCLSDATDVTLFDRHYVYHPAWAARIIAGARPAYHVDISSSLQFAALLSAFVDVRFYDYRPARVTLSGLTSEHADLLALQFPDDSVPSLSCMHVVEHIGLGRYGDALDASGDIRSSAELARVLAPGGTLLFVVPVGRQRIMFNAHRVYAVETVTAMFPDLTLTEFALIPDEDVVEGFLVNPPFSLANAQEYGCGCFRFTKPA